MNKVRGVAFVAVALLGQVFATARGISAAPPWQFVTAVAYGCPFSGAPIVTVRMQNSSIGLGVYGREQSIPATIKDGTLHFVFRAPPGPVYIWYSIDGKQCMTGGGGLIILPGHDRHIAFAMLPTLFVTDWHARKFVAGNMPTAPVSVSVVTSPSADCPDDKSPSIAATIDDGAYYVGYVHGAHLYLELRSASDDTLYIALPDATPAGSDSEYVRRDITNDDLRALNTHGLNENVQCIQSPSGTATRFP